MVPAWPVWKTNLLKFEPVLSQESEESTSLKVKPISEAKK
jgi:hypothetical protein